MPRYKEMPMDRSQVLLFGLSVEDALPADSDVRGFNDVMDVMDYSLIERKFSERGCPPYPPSVMVKLLGYAYSKGIRSSRRIEELLKIDVRLIWLAGGLRPDHNTIARFRKENHQELECLFKDSVRVCAEAGLVYLGAVATDGTKIRSAGSKSRMYTRRRLEQELAAVDKILQEAEEVDRSEDDMYGSGTGGELPAHLVDANARKAKLTEIARRLEESKKYAYLETDPDSRVMMTEGKPMACYNVQASVDSANQVIVAMGVTQDEKDSKQLPKMVEQIESNVGLSPDVTLADCGYTSEETFRWVEDTGHEVLMPPQDDARTGGPNNLFSSRCFLADEERDVLVCPAGRELTFRGENRNGSGTYRRYEATGCQSCSFRQECVGNKRRSRRVNISVVAAQRKRMRERLRTPDGRNLYALRQITVEPVFGQMKSNLGFRRFLLWGLEGAKAETALMCIAHNVRKCAVMAAAAGRFSVFSPVAAVSYLVAARRSWIRSVIAGPSQPCAVTF